MDLGVSVQSVALVTGYNILATGASGPFVSIFSRKYGKRPQYLIASTFALLGVIIGEVAQNYDQLLASRIVHGFGTAAYESIVLASIGDLFFVHEVSFPIYLRRKYSQTEFDYSYSAENILLSLNLHWPQYPMA